MKEKSFERELPEGYRQVYHLSATNVKVGIIFNLIAMVIFVLVGFVAAVPLFFKKDLLLDFSVLSVWLYIAIALMLVYMVLHELVHGAVYKMKTGEKLTFGLSWSCAFCGVPNIYVYRKTALAALVAPLILFTVIMLPLAVAMYYVSIYAYAAVVMVFAMHLGGCAGDAYMTILLLSKFKSNTMLMRDTGPEQFIYLKEN